MCRVTSSVETLSHSRNLIIKYHLGMILQHNGANKKHYCPVKQRLTSSWVFPGRFFMPKCRPVEVVPVTCLTFLLSETSKSLIVADHRRRREWLCSVWWCCDFGVISRNFQTPLGACQDKFPSQTSRTIHFTWPAHAPCPSSNLPFVFAIWTARANPWHERISMQCHDSCPLCHWKGTVSCSQSFMPHLSCMPCLPPTTTHGITELRPTQEHHQSPFGSFQPEGKWQVSSPRIKGPSRAHQATPTGPGTDRTGPFSTPDTNQSGRRVKTRLPPSLAGWPSRFAFWLILLASRCSVVSLSL